MDDVWVFVAVLAIVVVVLVFFGVLAFLVLRKFLMQTAATTHKDEARQVHSTVPNDPRHEHAGEHEYDADYFPGTTGKNARPAHLIVTLEHPIPGDFTILRETSFDRFCKRIGLAKEIQTNDRSFDDAFYIQTDTPEYARPYLADREKRQAIQRLFEMGFEKVDHDGEKLVATWTGFPHGGEECDRYAREAAESLVVLTRNLPAKPAITLRRRTLSRKSLQWVGWVGVILGIGLLIGFFIAMASNSFVLNHWGLFGTVLPVVGLAFLVYLWLAAWLVRGHSTSHLQLWSFFLAGIFLFPSLGLLGTERLNVWLDTSTPQEHVTTITNKRSKKNKNSYSYYVNCPSWNEPGRVFEFKINRAEYDRVNPGRSQIRMMSRAGWLGFEYVDSVTIQEPQFPVGGFQP